MRNVAAEGSPELRWLRDHHLAASWKPLNCAKVCEAPIQWSMACGSKTNRAQWPTAIDAISTPTQEAKSLRTFARTRMSIGRRREYGAIHWQRLC